MCSYYAKGSANYVGVWDYDEFFLPKGKYRNIPDILIAMGDPKGIVKNFHSLNADPVEVEGTWKGGRGLADGNGHPYCYLLLDSEVTMIAKINKKDSRKVRSRTALLYYSLQFQVNLH